MKKNLVIISFQICLILTLVMVKNSYSQLYQGPANGNVPNGVIVNTNNFPDYYGDKLSPYVMKPRNEEDFDEVQNYPDFMNNISPRAPEGSNKIKIANSKDQVESNPVILRNFQGFNDPGNYIPPDQHCTAGAQHIMGVDNSRLRIWDKNGNLLRTINANAWYQTALNGPSPFDPKVLYDHFSKRWIMVWLDQSNTIPRGYFLISVSQDSIPIGNWYNYAIKASLNGSTESGTWCDYQGVGFDSQALYITGRMFGFTGGFFGCKIRIIDKTFLYANTAGPLNWVDLWSIKDPSNFGITPDGIRPTVIYGNPSQYYFMVHGPFSTNSYVILYKLSNPVTSPVLTGVDIPVTAYSQAPNAQQLGGGSLSIEAGGSALRNEPTYRNGFLWFVHPVASGTGYSNISYLKINAATNAVSEDVSFGADPYYHFYPSIGVDANQNILISYSRSSPNEYIGAYFTYRLDTDPPNTLNGSHVLQAGKANYVKDFGSGRNRWGDYTGTWIDPSDQNNFWTLSQYAESPQNTWGSWMANIRLIPFSGARIFSYTDSLNFGNKEVNQNNTDTLSLKLFNFGSTVLTISALSITSTNFTITSAPGLPANLNFQDSVTIKVLCVPHSPGFINDTLKITSNDPTNTVKRIKLKCKGFIINPTAAGTLYGVAGEFESGALLNINTTSGTGTTIGPTLFPQLYGVSIRKSNGVMYGTYQTGNSTQIVRINSVQGDAYLTATAPVQNVRAIAWDNSDNLFLGVVTGNIYRYNIVTGDTVFVGSSGITDLYGLAINPVNNQLWGLSITSGLYKINKTNGTSTLVSNMGLDITSGITFSSDGKLFVTTGIASILSDLYRVDTLNGTPTLIGPTGKKGINGLAISPNPIGIEPISNIIPDKFELYQNYPNPFNPDTKIKFDVAKTGIVKIKIYDVTGRLVESLIDQNMNPGKYSAVWNAVNYPSGVYFYRIEAVGYTISKKMILLK